jgi:toxin ParE1/3/4
MRCSLHREALAEYREATLYYGRRSQGLAEAFAAQIEAAIAAIQTAPRTRAANPPGTRRYLVRRFPYIIHFMIEQDPRRSGEELIVIYAIRHSRRNQNYWLHRLPPEPSGSV